MIKKLTSSIFKILVLSLMGIAQANAQTTTAGILPLAKTQFLDENGNPLTSGKVYFYSPGTTTAKTTWQDINKTIANANPVVLDAGGRALIWGDGSYRQQVYDRNNNLKWDQVTATAGSGSGGGSTVGDGLPVGTIIPWAGIVAPVNYQFAYGQALSRTAYVNLLAALSVTTPITCVGGSPIITNVADTTSLAVGTVLEALCVSGSPTIISKTSNSVTLNANATISTNATGVFFLYGNGDGLTTFNLPDLRGVTLVGRCNMGGVNCSNLSASFFSTNANNTPSALNAVGGSQSETLVVANLPPIVSTNVSQSITLNTVAGQSIAGVSASASIGNLQVASPGSGSNWVPVAGGAVWGAVTSLTSANSISVNSTNTASTPFSLIQPSKTMNYVIKTNPDTLLGIASISQLQGGMPNKLTGTNVNGIFSNVNLPTGLTLASYNLNFLAQACAGSTWLKSIDINGVFTCTQPNFTDLVGSIAIGQIPNNLITNAKLDQAGAATIKGNPTAGTANVQDFTIQGLTARGAPDATNDKIPLYDNAAGIIKYVTPGQIASAGASGVSSLNGLTGALNGADLNTLHSVTANYTIANTDCGNTIQAGTGSTGQFTITLPAVAGFSTVCTVNVKNGDTARGKILSGFPADLNTILWPLQSLTVKIINGAWATTVNSGRWKQLSQITYHVDVVNGSNTNDGLATGAGNAVQTAQAAYNYIMQQSDTNNTVPIIAMTCSQTHTTALAMASVPVGTNLVQVSPDGNCSFTWTNSGACIVISDLAELDLRLNQYGSSGNATFGCNTSNVASVGQIYLHNDVVLDVESGPAIIWNAKGANDDFLFCDGKCQFTIGNGIQQSASTTGRNLVRMSAGGHGTFSGPTTPGATTTLSGMLYLFGGAMLNLGTSGNTGWSSIGATNVWGNATIVTNGITPQGGYAVGASAAACTSLTGPTC